MKFSKILVGFAAVLLLASCGNPGTSETESTVTEHTITFHANWNYGEEVEGEPAPKTLTVTDGAVVTADQLPVADERTGYAFKAWCTTPAAITAFDWSKAITKDYDVYASWVDLASMDEVTLVGTINGWDPTNDDYLLTTEDGIHYSIEDVTLKAGDVWKVVLNDSWDGQITGNNLNETPGEEYYKVLTDGLDAGNIQMLKSGIFDITVDLSVTNSLSFVKVGDFVDSNPTVDYEVYLAGSFTDPTWGADESTKFAGSEGVYTLTDYAFPAGEFKLNVFPVFQDGTKGDVAWLGTEVVSELPEGWTNNGGNIATVAGTYTVTFTITVGDPAANGVVTIEGESAEPVKAVISYVVTLAGDFTTPQWGADPNYMLMGPDATTGIWEGTYTLPDGQFKLNVFAMYEDYELSASATWVGASAMETMPEGWSGTDNIECVAGEYTLAYTITDGTNPGGGLLTVTAAGGGEEEPYEIMDPIPGEAFSLGSHQENLGEYYFFTGATANKDYYAATTTDVFESAEVRVEEVGEGTFRISYVDPADYAKKYICAIESGSYKNLKIGVTDQAEATVWTYNADYETFTVEIAGGTYYMGTYGTYTTISLSPIDYIDTSFPVHLYW